MPNLVGIGLSQVPTNSMLGGMAYQDPEHASIKDLDLKNLSQINSEIANTAVDVFIYDTSKDSDGGAWRKRTTHTSWYNETLGTATRGTRREFPAVAVIVAEQNFIKIYDGDDPNLPMWMVFTSGDAPGYAGPHLNIAGGSTLSAVAALNGEIAVSCNGGSFPFGSVQINFLKDRSLIRPDVGGKESLTGISKRNETGSYGSSYPYTALVNKFANDVAMTVLPNAPIDDATGLPIPTIAVATNGGVSFIKDDGTVVDWIESTGPDSTHRVSFRKDGKLGVFTSGTSGIDNYPQAYYITIPNTDVSAAFYYDFNSLGIEKYGYENESISSARLSMKGDLNSTLVDLVDSSDRTYAATDVALNIISRPESIGTTADMRTGMMDFVTSSYNTGWMHGDIKGAFLSDTDATNVTGTELVTNGTFDSDSDWSKGTGWSISGGVATHDGISPGTISQNITTIPGKTYKYTLEIVSTPSNISLRWDGSAFVYPNSPGTYTYYKVASSTTTEIGVYAGGASIDNFSVRIADPDRSVNNKGLQVFGTVTKSAVATGAELVAYSGWSASNYLEQPYNSDLNYGTGDFYFGGWFKNAGYSDSIIGRLHDSSSAGKGFLLSVSSSGGGGLLVFAIYTLGFQSSGRTTILTTTNETGKGWQQVWGIRRGGTMELWLNGNLVTTGSNTADISDATYNPPLFIGVQHGSAAFDGELALMRTGASAPSAEQIKKMYEDEKFLFQENAACTLYGSSDAVTALAYDEVTDKLHVGTSSGRSEFQGLCRINNTTTAVTTAISVHDEFIAEQ